MSMGNEYDDISLPSISGSNWGSAINSHFATVQAAINDSIRSAIRTLIGFGVRAQSTPDTSIAIDSGEFYVFDTERVVFSGNSIVDMGTGGAYELTAIPANYYNKILFTVDQEGMLVKYEGQPAATAANAVSPAIPPDEVPICLITVQDDGNAGAGTISAIQDADIADYRPKINLGLTGANKSFLVTDGGGLVANVQGGAYEINNVRYSLDVASGALNPSSVNYIYCDVASGFVINTTGFPNTPHVRLARVTTDASAILSIVDERVFFTSAQPQTGTFGLASLNDVSDDQAAAFAGADSPSSSNVFATISDVNAIRISDLEITDNGGLTINAGAGYIDMGGVMITHAGKSNKSVTANATNYVYVASGQIDDITISTTGFPTDATVFLPLAEVVTSGTTVASIVDRRTWLSTGKLPYHGISEAEMADDSVNARIIGSGVIVADHIDSGAAIPESRLALNNPTHSNANDPTTSQKAAMDAANSPASGNPFATLNDLGGQLGVLNDIVVVDAGGLTVDISGGEFTLNGERFSYAGETGKVMSDNNTNYLWFDADNGATLQVSTTGFPSLTATAVFRVATVTTSGGDINSISDKREIYHGPSRREVQFVSVGGAASSVAVTFNVGFETGPTVCATPEWDTTCYVSDLTMTGCTINFGTPAPGGGSVVHVQIME